MLLHCLLNPLTPLVLKSTIIFCLYRFNQEFLNSNEPIIEVPDRESIRNYDLQMEVLEAMTCLCKELREQTKQGVEFFAAEEKKQSAKDA